MKKKIFLILDESYFFQPTLVLNLIDAIGEKNFVGAIIIKKISKKNSINKYFLSKFFKFNFIELIIYILLFLKIFLKKIFNLFIKDKKVITVENVIKKKGIPYLHANYSLKKNYLYNFIDKKKPNIIISSCSLYIPRKIYNKKNRLCINRHSGKLPNYQGLLPIFHSLCNGENYLGVSIHKVEREIDSGKTISFVKFKVNSKSLYSLYQKSFKLSLNALITAVEQLKKYQKLKKYVSLNKKRRRYYKFPKNSDWCKFRKKGYKLIEWSNLLNEK
jgi:folate-dependent phosphoribosylglycinamide formyltransferase PurN